MSGAWEAMAAPLLAAAEKVRPETRAAGRIRAVLAMGDVPRAAALARILRGARSPLQAELVSAALPAARCADLELAGLDSADEQRVAARAFVEQVRAGRLQAGR
jgi:hypothetical protein